MSAHNCIDYGQYDTPTYVPSPTWPYTPPQPQPQIVWVNPTPSPFPAAWELAAQKAYEAMEAYYKALTAELEPTMTDRTHRKEGGQR